jgi:hypothetical protein
MLAGLFFEIIPNDKEDNNIHNTTLIPVLQTVVSGITWY